MYMQRIIYMMVGCSIFHDILFTPQGAMAAGQYQYLNLGYFPQRPVCCLLLPRTGDNQRSWHDGTITASF